MDTKEQNRFYHPELDGLRFLAFLLVFFNHAPYLGTGPLFTKLHDYGWLGVDVFLCLSAYLLTKLLSTEFQRSGQIDFIYFYVRRALRIWPLYFFFVLIVVILTLQEKDLTVAVARRIAGLVSFTDNIFSAFIGYNHLIYSPHLWTISFEEQFYAVIPWTVHRLSMAAGRTRFLSLALLFLFGTTLRALFVGLEVPHPAVWVLPLTHFESILGGMALGLGLFDDFLGRINKWILLFAGLGSLLVIVLLPNTDVIGWSMMLSYPLIGVGTTLLIHLALRTKTALLKNTWMSYLGKISYGQYIYHLACLKIAADICLYLKVQGPIAFPLAVSVIGFGLTMTVSALSYRYLEKPFLRMKERFAIVTSRPV